MSMLACVELAVVPHGTTCVWLCHIKISGYLQVLPYLVCYYLHIKWGNCVLQPNSVICRIPVIDKQRIVSFVIAPNHFVSHFVVKIMV